MKYLIESAFCFLKVTVIVLLVVFSTVSISSGEQIVSAEPENLLFTAENSLADIEFRAVQPDMKRVLARQLGKTTLDDPPPNDLCENSSAILTNSSVEGTTIEATIDYPSIEDSCGTIISVPGVWYSVSGTGAELTASVCDADYDTKLSVFCGDCDQLFCVGGNDDYCGLQSVFRWCSDAEQTYWILVHGYGGQTGSFTLVVNEGYSCDYPPACSEPPGNIDCETAITISGDWIDGTTRGAPRDQVPECSDYGHNSGVWYQVVGDGTEFKASTCSPETDPDFDSVLEVFCGTCEEPVCIVSNDDDHECSENNHSAVSWCSESGRTYWIRISGFQYEGDFRLSIESSRVSCLNPIQCFYDCSSSVENIFLEPSAGNPQYHCVFVCPNQPITIEIYPLYSGIRIPVLLVESGCDNPGLPPTTPAVDNWWYNANDLTWRTNLMTAVDADSGWVTISLDAILDVNLLSLNATLRESDVHLQWHTGMELSNDHFEIERDHQLIAAVAGSGDASSTSSYEWTDSYAHSGNRYTYELFSVSYSGERLSIGSTQIDVIDAIAVADNELMQNYPNPFNPKTTISFDLVDKSHVLLTVYNPLGQTIQTLIDKTMEPGGHSVAFNAGKLPSGLYFYSLIAGDYSAVKKMILMK